MCPDDSSFCHDFDAAVLRLVVLAGAPAPAGARLAGGARAAASGGTWRKAIEVPGTAALNRDHNGQTTAVSCASAGNCVPVIGQVNCEPGGCKHWRENGSTGLQDADRISRVRHRTRRLSVTSVNWP
jgi:hypothetical protein